MRLWEISIACIWVYPILALCIALILKRKPGTFRATTIVTFIFAILIWLLSKLEVSTTSIEVDFVLYFFIYFALSLVLCYFLFVKPYPEIQMLVKFSAIVIWVAGFFSGTFGALGVAFTMYNYEPAKVNQLTPTLRYEETPLGMATSDYRGIKVEVYRSPYLFPFLEKKVVERIYTTLDNQAAMVPYGEALKTSFNNSSMKLYYTAQSPDYWYGDSAKMLVFSDSVDLSLYK